MSETASSSFSSDRVTYHSPPCVSVVVRSVVQSWATCRGATRFSRPDWHQFGRPYLTSRDQRAVPGPGGRDRSARTIARTCALPCQTHQPGSGSPASTGSRVRNAPPRPLLFASLRDRSADIPVPASARPPVGSPPSVRIVMAPVPIIHQANGPGSVPWHALNGSSDGLHPIRNMVAWCSGRAGSMRGTTQHR